LHPSQKNIIPKQKEDDLPDLSPKKNSESFDKN
jgi:hypothetical protein